MMNDDDAYLFNSDEENPSPFPSSSPSSFSPPTQPIYIPNISSIAPPQMDNQYPEELRGFITEEEHQNFIEEVNEELREGFPLNEKHERDEMIERITLPTKIVGGVLFLGIIMMILGAVVGELWGVYMGLIMSIPAGVVFIPSVGYIIYLSSQQAKICEDVEERVSDMSLAKFHSRFLFGERRGEGGKERGRGKGGKRKERREVVGESGIFGGNLRRERGLFFFSSSHWFLSLSLSLSLSSQ